MNQPISEHQALAAKISTVVESYLPTQFERSAAHQQLQQRIAAVLADSPWLNASLAASKPADSEQEPEASAESRTVTLLLADIRGFHTLAETYSAKMLMNLLNRFYSLMAGVVQRYGGYIDRPMGDAMRVLFGLSQSKSNDVECALACAIAMQHAMNDYNQQNKELGFPELYMGIGINTGTVLAGELGGEQHTVIGDAVDLVSRIEAQSLRGQILMSEATFKLAQSYTLVGQSNSVQVKGRRKPVLLYELLGTTQPRTMTVPRREIRKSPRVAVSMPCYFQVVKGKQVKSQHCKAEVIDIGYHGFLILSPVPLEHFSEIKLEVSLNLLATDTSEIYARVLHCESVGQGFRCSLEFTTMDLAGQQSIKRFVDNMISG
ncbi:PilZ domain-containing protein [Dasania sp. GY-MA-18]|uniref:PilZ domain-containing protein n=1 Tax=Dasania phycosphaerae TaxID=2950436 RepID=A0A9J6RKL5_9GAMM|nr:MULTISPECIES: adenylate/guanylate cyclase domain-containing protein [Dasania]MCR8922445.1 PilZ domain-containing protein [Dasania sp. GY-MA-18]MCZ0864873.1 PilZ domain-containing protein [Dasania phycosphaerae]MCZ0868601.1 PilZ domain-containing protein [Dasania phycosphaerae]